MTMNSAARLLPLVILALATPAWGQTSAEGPPKQSAVGKAAIHHNEHPEGILPLLDYSGDVWSRTALTGDWGGARTSLAEKGLSAELSFSTVLQGVASGGADEDVKIGTSMDVWVHADLMRMGLIPGGLRTASGG